MALGTGSALAHRAVDSVLGSRHPEPAQATAAAQELVRENAPCADQVSCCDCCCGCRRHRYADLSCHMHA
jgi:hypothetical protein